MAYTLKSFLEDYPEITADQVLAFCTNTGDTLDSLAVHIERAASAGVSLKEYFRGPGRLKSTAGRAEMISARPAAPLTQIQQIARRSAPALYEKGSNR